MGMGRPAPSASGAMPRQGGGATTSAGTSSAPPSSLRTRDLQNHIDDLGVQLNNVHLTEAKKYALKKTLAMKKAELRREERRLRADGV
mmetsp:Transcript_38411/g.78366  ORF Transcript_38411/g.78366 Transcript_38411/m.78366 type:complete len:88 (+) Transcript_38411:1-264(+)